MTDLPFFDRRHRESAAALSSFVEARIAPLVPRDESDTDAVARQYVRELADGGWLAKLDPHDIRTACLIRERLGYQSPLADDMFAMQGLGGLPIALFGSPAQQTWFQRIKAGAIGAFALTEPDAGSDAAGMKLAARREGECYVLDGEKTFISNAGLADIYIVFARLTDGPAEPRFVSLIVPGDAAGLSATPIRLISAHPIGTLRFDGVRVPVEQRLGTEGDGLHVALGTLDCFRSTVAAAACGMARRALDEALAHVRSRKQFGRELAKFQGVQFMLADMATELSAAQLLTAKAAWMVDGERSAVSTQRSADSENRKSEIDHRQSSVKQAVSMAKLHATDHAHTIIDRAVQLLGGRGLVHGHPVERLYRDIRALRIYEGTSEIQRLVIARTLTDAE